MNKIFYMMSIILISFFVGGCSEEEDSISGSWTGDSYQINFSASTFYDVDDDGMVDEGEEMDLTCSSDLLQNEYICENFPCDWDGQSCNSAPAIIFADEGGAVSISFDGTTVAFSEMWVDPECAAATNMEECMEAGSGCHWMNGACMNMYLDDTCASVGTFTASGGLLNMTSTTSGEGTCSVFEEFTSVAIPYTLSSNQMTWNVPLSTFYYFGDYSDSTMTLDNNSTMTINWTK